MFGSQKPQRPGARRKCRARSSEQPGWLEVTTFATCIGRKCVIAGSGEMHTVVLESDSPLPYFITVRGTCTTDGVRYDEHAGGAKEWAPNPVHVAGRHRGPAVRREIARKLLVVEAHDDETIEVAISWQCVTNAGDDILRSPLVIQLDTRAAGS